MGKKKRNKIIREIAAQLPAFKQTVLRKELVNGSDILPPGVLFGVVNGVKLMAGVTYAVDQYDKIEVNHYNRMKKMVNAKGLKGAKDYINEVKAMQFKQDNK